MSERREYPNLYRCDRPSADCGCPECRRRRVWSILRAAEHECRQKSAAEALLSAQKAASL